MRTHVSPGVDVLHFLALAVSEEINELKSLKAVSRVAACCSPVGGVSTQ